MHNSSHQVSMDHHRGQSHHSTLAGDSSHHGLSGYSSHYASSAAPTVKVEDDGHYHVSSSFSTSTEADNNMMFVYHSLRQRLIRVLCIPPTHRALATTAAAAWTGTIVLTSVRSTAHERHLIHDQHPWDISIFYFLACPLPVMTCYHCH